MAKTRPATNSSATAIAAPITRRLFFVPDEPNRASGDFRPVGGTEPEFGGLGGGGDPAALATPCWVCAAGTFCRLVGSPENSAPTELPCPIGRPIAEVKLSA